MKVRPGPNPTNVKHQNKTLFSDKKMFRKFTKETILIKKTENFSDGIRKIYNSQKTTQLFILIKCHFLHQLCCLYNLLRFQVPPQKNVSSITNKNFGSEKRVFDVGRIRFVSQI